MPRHRALGCRIGRRRHRQRLGVRCNFAPARTTDPRHLAFDHPLPLEESLHLSADSEHRVEGTEASV
jgi:hypothetical protein